MSAAPWRPPPEHRRAPDALVPSHLPSPSQVPDTPAAVPIRESGMNRQPKAMEGTSARIFPHVDDLVARAVPRVDVNVPMRTLLNYADSSAKQADTHLDFNRPDLAYVEYLLASNILVHLIPRHKDFPALSQGRGDLWRINTSLKKRVNSQHERFEKVQELIKANNLQSGARPESTLSHQSNRNSLQPNRLPSPNLNTPGQSNGSIDRVPSPLNGRPPSQSQLASARSSWNGLPAPSVSTLPVSPQRIKPPVHPKPQQLHSRPISSDGGFIKRKPTPTPPTDDLAERFARLRPAGQGRPDPSQQVHGDQKTRGLLNSPQLTPNSSTTSLVDRPSTSSDSAGRPSPSKPQGPREMPESLKMPTHKLDTRLPNVLPRPPSPTYSPARNAPTPAQIHPPSTASSSAANVASNMAAAQPGPVSYPTHAAGDNTESHYSISSPEVPSHVPKVSSLSAQQLYDHLRGPSVSSSVLMIDVRDRARFDHSHIAGASVMCVEPVALRQAMSANDVEETLILSPEKEQAMFSQRHHFGLVVCYDQGSGINGLSNGPFRFPGDRSMEFLRQALQEFNYDKPLKQPPHILLGGLAAWTALVGSQALEKSLVTGDHAAYAAAKAGRPLGRVPMANSTARLEARRKTRDYEPLDIAEEQAWLQRVHGESESPEVPLDAAQPTRSVRRHSSVGSNEVESSFMRTYDDFLRRFPEPSDIRESMTSPSPRTETRDGGAYDQNPPAAQPVVSLRPPIPSPVYQPHQPRLPGAPSRPAPALPRQSYSGVSERPQYQPPAPARQAPIAPLRNSLVDTISSRSDAQIGRTGLTNFGATCYMNAVTQCLSATAPLTRHFLDGSYRGQVQKGNKWGSHGVLPEVYYNLMWHLWNGNYSFISPKTFRDFVSRLNKDFEDAHVQHDANDFFVFIVDALHEDLNVNYARTRLNDLSAAEERRREAMPPQIASRVEWNRWSHRNSSWVSQLFGGQHVSRLQCPVCGFRSSTYETFYSVSLEIPKKGRSHIYDCLSNYTKEERLSVEDSWICPDCKVPREASKKLTLTRAPHILVVQLKRFKSIRRGLTDKSSTLIDFPLVGLDLTPFTVAPLAPEDARNAAARYGHALTDPLPETSPPFRYDAYGVVQHFGTLTGGHYKALIRGTTARSRWLEFNDRNVNDFDAAKVASPAAYLLFYARSGIN
ncbi:MAG: hypothetical protein M1825_000572 [Sarcosagium campestre]|nr:MAG: hypothetical protein M1825_000572 [Sarcosagium campestre]